MIVKIIILRLLGSSDDKEREDRRSKTRRAAPTGVPPRGIGSSGAPDPESFQGAALRPVGAALWALLRLSSLSLCHHLNLKA